MNCKYYIYRALTIAIFLFCLNSLFAQTDKEVELFEAADTGDSSKVAQLISEAIDVNAKTWENISAIMFAAQNGHIQIVRMLIDAKADVNIVPDNGFTALIGAVRAEQGEIAELLILNDADINAKDLSGVSSLMYSAAYGYWTMCDMLLFYDAKLSKTNDNATELMAAATNGYTEIVELLILNGAKLEDVDNYGFTALQLAAQYGHTETVAFLIENGANINHLNNQKMSALALAVRNNHEEVVELLFEKDANPNVLPKRKLNLLNIARLNKKQSMVKVLKNHGVESNFYPAFNILSFSLVQDFNFNDYMLGAEIGISEAKSQMELNTGFCARPFQKAVLLPIKENSYYQLLENRSYFYAVINRKFYVPLYKKYDKGVHVGAKALFTNGRYEATKQDVSNQWKLAPVVGLFYETDILKLKLEYQYLDFGVYKNPPHRVSFTFGFVFEIFKVKQFNRRFNWM